jgi:hypothetical protein
MPEVREVTMRKAEDSKFYEMFQEIDAFIAELRKKHGGGQETIADSLMALCLMVAKVLSHEKLPASVAEGYIASFTRFIDSVNAGGSSLDKLMGKGSN